MGDVAEKWQAEKMIENLRGLGWPVAYGESLMNKATETEEFFFDKAFTAVLETPKTWMVLRIRKYGYEAVPESERTQ